MENRKTLLLRRHPWADLAPQPTEDEFEALKADIAAHGLHTPLHVTEDDVVLAGHIRLRIAGELQLETVPVMVKPGLSLAAQLLHLVGDNVNRRHLTHAQRTAMVTNPPYCAALEAVARARMSEGGRKGGSGKGEPKSAQASVRAPQTRDKLAEQAGVGRTRIQEAIAAWDKFPDRMKAILERRSKESIHRVYLDSVGNPTRERQRAAPPEQRQNGFAEPMPILMAVARKRPNDEVMLAVEAFVAAWDATKSVVETGEVSSDNFADTAQKLCDRLIRLRDTGMSEIMRLDREVSRVFLASVTPAPDAARPQWAADDESDIDVSSAAE